ncbi:MAG TPA: formate dehydrogenase accessory protein FdhE [Syntrophomonadaceae bacterium]|nr:formate dehydrogenase accessory protein FdhE [Syntrophomonadaceae bacterium]HOQ08761.1 formate dehydrogenase accessory protein FdhE [Syntrophomonadaceae bacterium]HPU47819.1 formate dehydrogenase accessory protein FdhE [Syntrophomonadaceae bacterium]
MDLHPPTPLPEGYLEFFQSLESWQNEQTIRLRNSFIHSKEDLSVRLQKNKKPLLSQINPNIDGDLLQNLLDGLLTFLETARPSVSEHVKKLKSNFKWLDFDNLVKAFLKPKESELVDTAKQLEIPEEFFIFVLDHALRPVLRLIAESYQEELANDFHWDIPAICPICGAKSHFSRLRQEDGQRIMFCDRCFSEWKTRYLFCVHCGCDHPNDISYLSVEGNDAYRVYVCKQCHGYLKTYDERTSGRQVDMYIANIGTIYLDMLAQEQGYTNHDGDYLL